MKSNYKVRGTRARTNNFSTHRQNQSYIHKNTLDDEESNLSRFWRECRERDIRKRRRMSNQFASNHNHFAKTIAQLKFDAEILSNRFQRTNAIKNANKENRRHSNIKQNRNVYAPSPNISNAANHDKTKLKSSKTQSFNTLKAEQSENSKIFFENRQYYSSLRVHNKHNQKYNQKAVYNYFDSLRNDEATLKYRLKQKWTELKKDVNKLNYFKSNENKTPIVNHSFRKETLSNTFPPSQKKAKNVSQKIYKHATFCFKLQKSDKSANNSVNEQKDQESHSPQLQSEIVENEITQNELESQKNEFIAPEKKDSIEPVVNVTNVSNIEDMSNMNQSSIYSVSHLRKSNEYWDFSVRELKNKLLNMNVCIDECIEKKDLIQKIKDCDTNKHFKTNKQCLKKPRPNSAKQPRKCKPSEFTNLSNTNTKPNTSSIIYDGILSDTGESQPQIMNRIDVWIDRWSYRRSFRQLLNSILGNQPSDQQYLCRGVQNQKNYCLVMKSYKKAIVLVHPDKHVNSSFEVKYKSAEMFKIIVNLCEKYKKRYDARNKMC